NGGSTDSWVAAVTIPSGRFGEIHHRIKLKGHQIMGIKTIGKHMAIGASPTVQPHPTVTRYRFVGLWFSAGIVVSVLLSLRFLNYRELPHLYQELQHLVPFARQPDAPNNSLLLQMASQATDL